jgi:hypothetical protein
MTFELDVLLTDFDALLLPGVPFRAPTAYDETVDIDGVAEDRDTAFCRKASSVVFGRPE